MARRVALAGLLASIAWCASRPAHATIVYSFRPLAETAALFNVTPSGINDAGTVVGRYNYGYGPHDGFVDKAGTVTTFASNPLAGINDKGDIVGSIFAPIPQSNGFSQQPTFTGPDATPLPGQPSGINNDATVVGALQGTNQPTSQGSYLYVASGYLDQAGAITMLSVPGIVGSTYPSAINNLGTVVGEYNDGLAQHGFIYSAGVYSLLDVPGSTSTMLNGINDLGQVVGSYTTSASPFPIGFVEQDGVFQDLLFGLPLPMPTAINNSGVIAGYFYGGGGKYGTVSAGGFTATPQATPVPEPTSLALLAAGLVGAGLLRRRVMPRR